MEYSQSMILVRPLLLPKDIYSSFRFTVSYFVLILKKKNGVNFKLVLTQGQWSVLVPILSKLHKNHLEF